VDGTTEVKRRILGREFAGEDEVPVLDAAYLTETHRTCIPAPVAFDALVELFHPVLQPFILVQFFIVFKSLTSADPLSLLPYNPFRRIRLVAFARFGQCRRAGNAHRHNSIAAELIPLEEFVQSSLVASPYHDAEVILGVSMGQLEEHLIQGIPDIPYNQRF
jgi:hypothetical protein